MGPPTRRRPRLDQRLTEDGLAPSREKARALILAGQVLVDGQRTDKPGTLVAATARLELIGSASRYVGRGGEKLQSAWEVFAFEAAGRTCMDVGASTGGFTDFLLQHGAKRVYAIDVGYGQLAWSLRQDPRVVVLERLNARLLSERDVPEAIELAVLDVSFISLDKVMPEVAARLAPAGEVVALVKPQFEAGPSRIGKKGVVRDAAVHTDVLASVLDQVPRWGLGVRGLTHSRLRGPEGNIEFFLYLARGGPSVPVDVSGVVAAAHAGFAG